MIVVLVMSMGAFAQSQIGGVRWQLTEMNGKRVTNSRLYIEFDESQLRHSGFSGCNRFTGGYELSGEEFKTKGTASTRMACMRLGAMEMEQQFLKALGDASRLRKSGVNLSIFNGKTRVLRFRPISKPDEDNSAELTSKKWMLRSIAGTPVALAKNAAFLTFDAAKKQAGGNGGCNGFGGSYEVEGSAIKFGNIISTMMACELENRMTIEQGFLGALQNADRFEIAGNKLILFKGNDKLLEFEGTAK